MITVPFLTIWLTLFSGATGMMGLVWLKKRAQPQPALAPIKIHK